MSANAPGAVELVTRVLDPGSWASWDDPITPSPDLDPDYAEALRRASARAGLDESVLTGEGRLRGRRVAVVACEFEFLAGSIGVAAAGRLVRAVERATAERLPLLALPSSGGTRMQEGTVAFVQMVMISAAVVRHRRAGLPYLVYLRHPTTGGVLASWGSLGDVTLAEPGALIGFMGPRIHQVLHGEEFPAGVQVAENLMEHGILDAVVDPTKLPHELTRVMDVLCAARDPLPDVRSAPSEPEPADIPAWESIQRSRRPDRPALGELLTEAATHVTLLSGTGVGEREHGLLLALARFGGAPCVVLGHDRVAETTHHPLGPAGLRVARRGLRLAAQLDLPLLSVIDTAGAAVTPEAEEAGLAGEIARCLSEFVTLEAPTVSLLLGQGAGGAALALVPADRVVAAQHAWLSPLPPEGASAILYRTADRAPELAGRQGVRSADLLHAGIVDRVVAENPDAADERHAFLDRLARVIAEELVGLLRRDPAERAASRLCRYRSFGVS